MKRVWLVTVLGFILLSVPAFARSALILYDGEKGKSDAFLSARFTYCLLGHFALNEVRLDSFRDCPPEQASAADFLIAICEDGRSPLPPTLLQAIAKRSGPIVWINLQLDELLNEAPGRFPLQAGGEIRGRNWKISYADHLFRKTDAELQTLLPGGGKDGCRVLAWARDDDGRQLPYVVHGSNLWVFADSPFAYALEGGRWLIFSDLLHEILGQEHDVSRQALLRIEDVNPQSDPASIKAIASYLADEDVPFQISLIPIYLDPGAQEETDLSDNPELVAALHFAVSKGATIVMHGITHQYRGASTDDCEFWDLIAGIPIASSTRLWVERKINSGLRECCRNGLYPIAWETPHYAASQNDYQIIGSFFNTFFDRPMVADIPDSQMLAPYPYRLPDLGVQVVPENLGYIDLRNRPRDLNLMLRNLGNMGAVRDALASFYFHPFLPLEDLQRIVKAVKARGWTFVSLREFRCHVRESSRWITTAGGDGSIVLLNQYLHEITFDSKGAVRWEKYSPDRLSDTIYRHVKLAPGELHVIEAVDLLPESKQGGWRKFRSWLGGLFQRQKSRPLIMPQVLILSSRSKSEADRNDQRSFTSLLNIFGFNPQIRELSSQREFSLAGFNFVVVPQAAANELMAGEMNSVLDFVKAGGILITDGRSELAEKMTIRFLNQALYVTQVRDLSLPLPIYKWNPPVIINPFRFDDGQALCLDNASNQPLVIVKPLGRGQVLYIATLLDPYTPFGISRYPYFPFYLKNVLGLPFPVRRSNLEFYFDPGLRQNISWERLVRRWRASGVKIVYLAAWHFYPNYRFDYDYFIGLCHDFGIAVYAWFELPQVTPLFWDAHPQWREKTAAGLDARVGWRYAMNLFNPDARQKVKDFFWLILTSYDWDGINLAELSYDTNRGLENPDQFVPLNSDVRQAFQRRSGIDPQEFFDASSAHFWQRDRKNFNRFLQFRCEMVKDLHDFFLGETAKIMAARKKEMEVIVTALDSLLNPKVSEAFGIDSRDLIALMAKHRFTLQVEDPASSWLDPPDRYLSYIRAYQAGGADVSRLMFDINVTPRPGSEARHLPSPQPIGSELATTFYYAARASGRVGLYAESTVNPFDMDILPFVIASDVSIKPQAEGFRIESLQPFTLVLNDSGLLPMIDGQAWPFYQKNNVFLPSGQRLLTFAKPGLLKGKGLTPQLTFGGDIYDLSVSGNVYSLRYDSPTPVTLTFSRPLERIRLDGETLAVPLNKTNLILARGRHRLEIYTQNQSSYAIEVVGFFSSTIFLVLGLSSLSLLLFLYFYSRSRR